MTARVIIVCNALDDATRQERGITTDSPAASRKVFQLCAALRTAGVRPLVLSLGRGRADGTRAYFGRHLLRINGVPVIYSAFSRMRRFSEMLSLFEPGCILLGLRREPRPVLVFYNREPAYVLALLMGAALRYPRVLDLEDGAAGPDGRGLGLMTQIISRLYDRLCSRGALLACSALAGATSVRPLHCYYGTAESFTASARWAGPQVSVLMGGTLAPDTGVDLLIEAVQTLQRTQPDWARRLHVEVTGKGPSLEALRTLTTHGHGPSITVHGRMTDAEYKLIVARCDVGLALKPSKGPLANTTFPSKVVELASAGLLVLTTDISDVRAVLGDGALYLERDGSENLIELLRMIVLDPEQAQRTAQRGSRAVWQRCDPSIAGRAVADFLFRLT